MQEIIDYRVLADERADEFIAKNIPQELADARAFIKQAYKIGFIEGHIHASDKTIAVLTKAKEFMD